MAVEKFHRPAGRPAEPMPGRGTAGHIVDLVGRLDELDGVEKVTALLRPGSVRSRPDGGCAFTPDALLGRVRNSPDETTFLAAPGEDAYFAARIRPRIRAPPTSRRKLRSPAFPGSLASRSAAHGAHPSRRTP